MRSFIALGATWRTALRSSNWICLPIAPARTGWLPFTCDCIAQPDGKLANQQAGEVFVDCGAAPFNFDKRTNSIILCGRLVSHRANSGFIGAKISRAHWKRPGQK
jgi:hypothetical protein